LPHIGRIHAELSFRARDAANSSRLQWRARRIGTGSWGNIWDRSCSAACSVPVLMMLECWTWFNRLAQTISKELPPRNHFKPRLSRRD